MEKRLLLAIVLSFLVLFGYQALFIKEPTPPAESQPALSPPVETPPPSEDIPSSTELPPDSEPRETSQPEMVQPVSSEAELSVTVETSLYRAVWTNKGAVLRSWKLREYTDENEEDFDLISRAAEEVQLSPLSLSLGDPGFDTTANTALYQPSVRSLDLDDGETGQIRFEFADPSGNRIEKIFTFTGGSYTFDVDIEVWREGRKVEPRLVWGPGLGNPSEEDINRRFGATSGIVVYTANKVFRMEEKKFDPAQNVFNFVRWAAYEDNYFTALFITDPQRTSVAFVQELHEQTPFFAMTLDYPQTAYLGPKDIDELTELGYDSKKLIKFGFFGVIAELLLKAIRAIHGTVPNWGFSIILLTILIKIIFLPLTISSTRSMAKMQELQPKIKALRSKYKKAKQDIQQRRKMNEEIMALYKQHGVNPAGGCLPILIQLPIFWGFFQMLRISIEFRQSPFIFWIKDLSIKDPFYVTPILMGLTQFISQKMTPTSADPTQQRMMLIMPVVMTIFFMNFQSGLVLYWLTNNVLQIAQQYVMNNYVHKHKREPHGQRRKK